MLRRKLSSEMYSKFGAGKSSVPINYGGIHIHEEGSQRKKMIASFGQIPILEGQKIEKSNKFNKELSQSAFIDDNNHKKNNFNNAMDFDYRRKSYDIET